MEYHVDETLEIKEEIILDQDTITHQKRNTTNEHKLCTVNIREADIFAAKCKLLALKEEEIQEKKYICKKCVQTYKYKTSLIFHQKFECDVMPQFSCKFCSQPFKRKSHMNEHIVQVHHKTSLKKSVLTYKCDKCLRSFSYIRGLFQHKRLIHAAIKSEFACDYCSYKSKQKVNLSKHITSKHLNKKSLFRTRNSNF
ncbi:zinc finger protein 69-like [Belonocnema kinseyi]|uniref:zinc finger protein 69-like n=1 Tax=Belonocnema kinseyi TaxID=2817044 RepID=UPI00143DFC5F|nr:zinc finger protein 69-like [Belonocnema kinseyi]